MSAPVRSPARFLAERAMAATARPPILPSLPMMAGWTLPTPPSIPSLPT